MDTIRLTTRGKIVLAVAGLIAVMAAIYAVTPEDCRDSSTNRTDRCAEYLR